MTLVAIFLVNAGLSFALSLVLAGLLGPDGFGRYAIGLAAMLVLNTVLFEWLRLSTTRFYGERARLERPEVRATLDRAYLAGGAALAFVTAGALALGLDLGLSGAMLAAASGCGFAYGLCEYRMALARARFQETAFALLCVLRGLFGFLFCAGAAYATGDPALVLACAALSAVLPVLFVRRALVDPATPGGRFRMDRLAAFGRYGLPLVAASVIYQLLPLLNRTMLAGRDGFTEAGYLSLASELATRLFQNLGTALDLVLFQLAVRAEDLHGRAAAEGQIARNAAIVAAIVLPSGAGLWAVWPSFEGVFIPAAFRGHLADTMASTIPALACFALVQFALAPVFQLRGRTAPVVAAALVAITVDLAAILLWPGLRGATGFAAAQLAALAAGLLVLCALAGAGGARLPWRDLAGSSLASAAMTAALWPLRELAPTLLALTIQVVLGVAIYGGLALVLDIAQVRTALLVRLRGRDAVAP